MVALLAISLIGCAGRAEAITAEPATESAFAALGEPANAEPVDVGDASLASFRTASPLYSADARWRVNELHAMLVRVPAEARDEAERVWGHVREDAIDAGRRLQLSRNGVRVGVGRMHWWDAIQTELNAIAGIETAAPAGVLLPPGHPLLLELDDGPRDQLIFYAAGDATLSGASWPQSRNVLRISAMPDRSRAERTRVDIVPEVRFMTESTRWAPTVAGMTAQPAFSGRAFGAASVSVSLAPDEFILIAPHNARNAAPHRLGEAFLAMNTDGAAYDSYVFVRTGLSDDPECP